MQIKLAHVDGPRYLWPNCSLRLRHPIKGTCPRANHWRPRSLLGDIAADRTQTNFLRRPMPPTVVSQSWRHSRLTLRTYLRPNIVCIKRSKWRPASAAKATCREPYFFGQWLLRMHANQLTASNYLMPGTCVIAELSNIRGQPHQ